MSEENTAQTSEQPSEAPNGADLSLDDLYGEFQPQQTQPAQSNTQQQQAVEHSQPSYLNIPDPVADVDGFKGYIVGFEKKLAAAQSEVRKAQERLAQKERELAIQAEERDFRGVAEEIAQKAGVDGDLVEAGLLHKFVKDKGFQQMWQNRNSNPAAFKKAKAILANEMRNRFAMKVDPQLAENQRAAEEASRGVESKKGEEQSLEERLMKAPVGEFDMMIRQLRGSTTY